MANHILLIGKSHSGMTGLVNELVNELATKCTTVYGFYSDSTIPDETGLFSIYLQNYQSPAERSLENLIGTCREDQANARPEGFLSMEKELSSIPDESFVVLNQLGSMETSCPAFCETVLSLFDRCHVLAVLRDKEIPFLMSIRNRNDVTSFYMKDLDYDQFSKTVLTSL